MRPIKFRAWDRKNKRMMVVPDISFGHDGSGKTILLNYKTEVGNFDIGLVVGESCDLMQFTGLTDKNGKEIYESDKVRILYTDWGSQGYASEELKKLSLEDYKKAISDKGVIVWKDARWQVEFEGRFGKEYGSIFPGAHGEIEITGNIYEG